MVTGQRFIRQLLLFLHIRHDKCFPKPAFSALYLPRCYGPWLHPFGLLSTNRLSGNEVVPKTNDFSDSRELQKYERNWATLWSSAESQVYVVCFLYLVSEYQSNRFVLWVKTSSFSIKSRSASAIKHLTVRRKPLRKCWRAEIKLLNTKRFLDCGDFKYSTI